MSRTIALAIILALTCVSVAQQPDGPTQRPGAPLPPIATEPPKKPEVPAGEGVRELFPGVRINMSERWVEFDGTVPIRVDDPRAPRVYLEQVVCIPDTKEHESLVAARVQPSHVHAALLALGLNPGKPAGYEWVGKQGRAVPPEGDGVELTLRFVDRTGTAVTMKPGEMIKNARTGEDWPASAWVFAGSVMRVRQGREVYDADGTGTLIGLASFGSEVIAPVTVFSPDSQIDEPVWIANEKTVPPMDTKVTVRLAVASQ
jgi:hypothetical protein